MVIVSCYTEEYTDKVKKLAESLELNGFDDFILHRYEAKKLKSYREHWPTNRKNYATPQAGEQFPQWFHDNHDEIIIELDADTVMERAMTRHEIGTIELMLQHADLLSVYGAYPPNTMMNVLRNLGCDKSEVEIKQLFPGNWDDVPEFTASFMVATARTFEQLGRLYVENIDKIAQLTGHHAGGQWLINFLCWKHFKTGILPVYYQCGSWYDGANMENVIFNHTK